ncbi:hypothetical protein TSMEX_000618 [Taenia solium]|eukprot:TsM_001121300 transcript=TsM_001121300 gene=TsM_001121300
MYLEVERPEANLNLVVNKRSRLPGSEAPSSRLETSNLLIAGVVEEEREDSSTLVTALSQLPHFKEGMSFGDWIKSVWFTVHSYPQRQKIPLILRPLPQELFLAAIYAEVSANSDSDHCCEEMAQLVIDQREQLLTREFFHRDQ